MKKRIISIILSITMMFLMLPASTFAAGVSCGNGSTCNVHAAALNGRHYDTVDAAIKDAKDGDTINILCKYLKDNSTETVPIVVRNKSLHFVGEGHSSNSEGISNTFIIKHTTGGHTVTFDNLRWYLQGNSAIQDMSVCSGENDVNVLQIDNCLIDVNGENKENIPAIGIFGTKNKDTGITASGTKLVMTSDEIKTMHYNKGDVDSDVDTYFNGYAFGAAISTSCEYINNYKFRLDGDVYHYAKAEISKCKINGYFKYAFIGGYADFLDNSIRMSYYSSYSQRNMGKDCLKICGASSQNNGGQCDVIVAGGKFYNIDGILATVANVDGDVASSLKSQIIVTGADNGVTINGTYYKKNTFEEVNSLVYYDSTGTAMSVKLSSDLMTKNWTGIKDSEVGIYIGSIPFKKYGNIESDYMLTDSGLLAKTYTQMPVTEGERTGFYYDFKGNGKTVRLWYLCNYGKNCYLVTDDSNNIYATYVAASGGTSEFEDMRKTLVPTSLSYAEVTSTEASSLEGKLYSLGYKATVLDGNTYRNAVIEKDGDTYKVKADTSRGLTDYDIIVYLSDNGGNRKTYLTYDEFEKIDTDSVRIVMPEINLTKVSYAGTRDINISANVKELEIDGECSANIETIANVDLINVRAMAKVNNNGTIKNIVVGHDDTQSMVREDIQNAALGAVIQNNKTIGSIVLNTAANIYNGKKNYNVINKEAVLTNVTIGNPYGIKASNGNSVFFANGSVVENYANINNGSINIYTQTEFDNFGTIADTNINFGYLGKNDDHSDTIFNNSGEIVNGKFTIYGASSDKQFTDTKLIRPVILGENTGSITGTLSLPTATYQPLHGFLTSTQSGKIDIFSENMSFDYPEYVNGNDNEFTIKSLSGVTGWALTCDDKSVIVTKYNDGYKVTNMPTESTTVTFRLKVPTNNVVVPITVLVRSTPEYEIPTGIEARYNTYLDDVILPEGFSWMDDTQEVGELGEKVFLAKFTPDDLETYHVVNNIEIKVNVIKGIPLYETPSFDIEPYGTRLDDLKLPEGFFFEEYNEKDVGPEGINTLYVYYVPEDELRFEQVHDIPVNIEVTHNYGHRTHTCDYCGRVDPTTRLTQEDTKLKIKNYAKNVTSGITDQYPDFASFVNVLVNASKSKNDLTDPNGFSIYNIEITFKSNGKRVKVTDENFPVENIGCKFSYSELGTNDTYNYTVVEILDDGTLLYPQVLKTENGISFDIEKVSPVLISWYADENTVFEKAKTSVSTFIWITLFVLIFAILSLIFMKKNFADKASTDKRPFAESLNSKIDDIKQKVQNIKKNNK